MDYREILREHLKRRQALNPRFSLRSFAAKLEISPSKISEVLSGKKRLSLDRLEIFAKKLNLKGAEKEIFLLSAELEASKGKGKGKDKEELKARFKKLAQDIKAEPTTQRNAWYFGAVKALLEAGLDPQEHQKSLGLTTLQIENAVRFLNRIKRFYPERDSMTFETLSVMKKFNEALEDSAENIGADFLFLTEEQTQELALKIKSLLKKFKNETKNDHAENLQMVHFGITKVLKGD